MKTRSAVLHDPISHGRAQKPKEAVMLIPLLSLVLIAGLARATLALRRLWQALPRDNHDFSLEEL